jgi:hypothetical protein
VTRRELSPKSGRQTAETIAQRAGYGNLAQIRTLGNHVDLRRLPGSWRDSNIWPSPARAPVLRAPPLPVIGRNQLWKIGRIDAESDGACGAWLRSGERIVTVIHRARIDAPSGNAAEDIRWRAGEEADVGRASIAHNVGDILSAAGSVFVP